MVNRSICLMGSVSITGDFYAAVSLSIEERYSWEVVRDRGQSYMSVQVPSLSAVYLTRVQCLNRPHYHTLLPTCEELGRKVRFPVFGRIGRPCDGSGALRWACPAWRPMPHPTTVS
jgi:hypothetical protein